MAQEVRVLYFAALRDLVGLAEEDIQLTEKSVSLEHLLGLLSARHPRLRLESVRVALNEEFVDKRAAVAPGDVVALIPPVSGG